MKNKLTIFQILDSCHCLYLHKQINLGRLWRQRQEKGINNYFVFQIGFKYSLEVKAYAEWHGYKYEHVFDKIDDWYEWKK